MDKAEAEGVGELRRLLSQLRLNQDLHRGARNTHHKITLITVRLVQLPGILAYGIHQLASCAVPLLLKGPIMSTPRPI